MKDFSLSEAFSETQAFSETSLFSGLKDSTKSRDLLPSSSFSDSNKFSKTPIFRTQKNSVKLLNSPIQTSLVNHPIIQQPSHFLDQLNSPKVKYSVKPLIFLFQISSHNPNRILCLNISPHLHRSHLNLFGDVFLRK